MAARSSPRSCAAPLPSCRVWPWPVPHRAVLAHWDGKPYHDNRMRKLVHARRQRNFIVKAKEGVRQRRCPYPKGGGIVGSQQLPFVIWQLLDRGSGALKAWPSSEGNISEGLPGQKGRMGPCKGDWQHSSCSSGPEPVSPCGARSCLRHLH